MGLFSKKPKKNEKKKPAEVLEKINMENESVQKGLSAIIAWAKRQL